MLPPLNTPIEIPLTQEDIDLGLKKACEQCPIVRAVRRRFQLSDEWYVAATGSYVRICKLDSAGEKIPQTEVFGQDKGQMTKFVYNFDNRKPVKPTVFTLVFTHQYAKQTTTPPRSFQSPRQP